jgi:anti-sigma B factor antagonist
MEEQRVVITERSAGPASVIAIGGRLDAASSAAAFKALEQSISQGTSAIVLDLSGLTYTSSSGLRAFLALLKQLRKENREMMIARPNPRVLEVFAIAGFDRIFPIYDTVDEAVGAVVNA